MTAKSWKIILLVIFYPVGLLYLIYLCIHYVQKCNKKSAVQSCKKTASSKAATCTSISSTDTPTIAQPPAQTNITHFDTEFLKIPIVYKKDVKPFRDIYNYIVYDTETTGLNPPQSEIIEIAMIKITNGVESDRFSTFVKPKETIPAFITKINGITNEDVANAPTIDEIVDKIVDFIGTDYPLIAHNATFDNKFLYYALGERGLSYKYIDTLDTARSIYPELSNHRLETFIGHFGLADRQTHRAMDDAKYTQIIFEIFCDEIMSKSCHTSTEVQPDREENLGECKNDLEAETNGVHILRDAYLEYYEEKCFKIIYTALFARAVPDINLHAKRRVESFLSIYNGDTEFLHLKCGTKTSWFALDSRLLSESEGDSLSSDYNFLQKGRYIGIRLESYKEIEYYNEYIYAAYMRAGEV